MRRKAAAERAAYDDRRALQRRHFEEGLADLNADLQNHEITRAQYNQRLLKLYKAFGIPLKNRGKLLGLALAEGLNEAEVDVKKASMALLEAIKKQLERMEFVVSVLLRDAGNNNNKKGADGARAKGGPVRGGGSYLVGERGPELFIPDQSGRIVPNAAGGGGGDVVVQSIVYLDGKQIYSAMQRQSAQYALANGTNGL